MKNNTRIRLHLSKQLFESLTKQVLAEAKVNDGYSEAVKQPKQAKETKAQKAAPEVKSTDKMKKMEEKMSSKEKMAKGLYKETDMEEAFPTAGGSSTSKLGADMIKKGQAVKSTPGLSAQEIQSIQAILDLIINKAPQGETAVALQKALTILTQNTKNVKADTGTSAKPAMPGLKEMETEVSEGDLDEISGAMDLLQQSAPIWGTALGIAGTWLATWLANMKKVEGDDTRTPEEKAKAKEKLQQDLVRQMNRSKGF